ncbi:MAG: hypothetical protein ACRD1P_00395 [Thermoanaerobaculia bacterium]
MPERKTDPPAPGSERPKRATGSGRGQSRLDPDQYEIKIRWEKARRVLGVSPTGVKFDFNTALQVGSKYPISLTAPGVSLSSTVEVTRCQLTVEPAGARFFRIEGRFFPYLE